MSTDPIYVMTELNTPQMLTAAEYAERHDVSLRTVKRWLAAEELPGQIRNNKGWWMIPAGAVQTPHEDTLVAMSRPGTDVAPVPQAGAAVKELDKLPTFLTLDQAAHVLGISRGTISGNRKYFRVVKIDRNLVVPLYRIKKLRGV